MRSFITAVGLVAAAVLITTPSPDLRGDERKGDSQAELKKVQGLWMHLPGGIDQQDGGQVVRGPARDGPCFFILGDKLIWLDKDGKPSGDEETVVLDPAATPKRIKFTKKDGTGKEHVVREGIYEASADAWTIEIAQAGKPVPKQFLEFNKPVKGVDGRQWLVGRCTLKVK
jgi:uncharacterized protein (TIGR03067 family)